MIVDVLPAARLSHGTRQLGIDGEMPSAYDANSDSPERDCA
jgi:hypothetical protein